MSKSAFFFLCVLIASNAYILQNLKRNKPSRIGFLSPIIAQQGMRQINISPSFQSYSSSTFSNFIPITIDINSLTLLGKKIDDEVEKLGLNKKKKSKNSKQKNASKLSNAPQSTELNNSSNNTNNTHITIENLKTSTSENSLESSENTELQSGSMDSDRLQYEKEYGPISSKSNIIPATTVEDTIRDTDGKLSSFSDTLTTSNSLFDSVKNQNLENTQNLENKIPAGKEKSLLEAGVVPPEIIFFGDPRRPPPAEAASDPKLHGRLLFWARHAHVAPRTSQERLEYVFPTGRLHPLAPKFRFTSPETLTYDEIYSSFKKIMNDIESSKAFISSNIDLIPPRLFLRAMSARKLAAQYQNNLSLMEEIKNTRDRYIIANDQLFFPMNIEVAKAETRVMTYMARQELREFAKSWDSVEMSLHFTTLLSARVIWDEKVRSLLVDIKKRVEETVGYMAEGVRQDLLSRQFRKPSLTAELYLNASNSIQQTMPELYAKVNYEQRFMHETYFMKQSEEIVEYATKVFCVKEGISPDQLKERLKILDACLASVQGIDYVELRVLVQDRYRKLCSPEEFLLLDKWFFDYKNQGYGFETYEPDVLPTIIETQQDIRDTGNAFLNFATEVLKLPASHTYAFAGKRPKASDPRMDRWLERDPDFVNPKNPESYEDGIESFREAYMKQSQLRKEAMANLNRFVEDRMDMQDRILSAPSKIMEFGGDDGTLE